jgi:anaerobic magnesium-protoporphyrin IX monomethyl ester cyclase
MPVKVHFVLSAINIEFPLRWLLEIGQYAAFLKQSNLPAKLTLLLKPDDAQAADAVQSERPEILVLSALPGQSKPLWSLAETVRGKLRSSLVIAAGLLPTLDPEGVIAEQAIDALLLGEGEIALVELASALERGQDYRTIRNFWIKDHAGIVQKNPLRPLTENLDIFPYPDRKVFDHERWLRVSGGNVSVIASRGCTHYCLFCHEPRLKEIYKGKGPVCRVRSAVHIIGEIAEIARDHEIKRVTFLDEMFPLELSWLADFTKRYSAHFKVPFTITSSVEKLNQKTLDLLKTAGCDTIVLGIETGNQAFRKKLTDRNVATENVAKAASLIQSLGMNVVATNMIGLPLEKPEMIRETLELNRQLRPDEIRVSVFDPLPSTRLYEFCKEKHYLGEASRAELQPWESTLRLPGLSPKDIRDFYEAFHLLNSMLCVASLKEKKGYFDFIADLAKAKVVSPHRFDVRAQRLTLYGETRTVIAQRVNSALNYDILLEDDSALSFGLAVLPSMIPAKGKIQFTIEVVQDGYAQTAFQRIVGAEQPQEMRWFDYDLPLLDMKEGAARISLKVESLEKEKEPDVWGVWSYPFLSNRLVKVAGKLKVVEGTGYEDTDQLRRDLEEEKARCSAVQNRADEYERRVKELEAEIKQKTQRIAELSLTVHGLESDLENYRKHVAELEQIREEYQRSLGKKIKGIFRKK